MRHKILIGVLVLAVITLSGLTYGYYSISMTQRATMNNMRSQIIAAWATQMYTAAHYLNNTRTNIEMQTICNLLRSITDTALTTYTTEGGLYTWMPTTTDAVVNNLVYYSQGFPSTVRNISPTAINMIKDLAQKIQNTTLLIISFSGPGWDLTHPNGEDPIKIIEEKGVLNSTINGCTDIQHLSEQIRDIEPKFQ